MWSTPASTSRVPWETAAAVRPVSASWTPESISPERRETAVVARPALARWIPASINRERPGIGQADGDRQGPLTKRPRFESVSHSCTAAPESRINYAQPREDVRPRHRGPAAHRVRRGAICGGQRLAHANRRARPGFLVIAACRKRVFDSLDRGRSHWLSCPLAGLMAALLLLGKSSWAIVASTYVRCAAVAVVTSPLLMRRYRPNPDIRVDRRLQTLRGAIDPKWSSARVRSRPLGQSRRCLEPFRT